MIRAAVVGASGYTGIELLRLLHRHPQVEITCMTGDSTAGKEIQTVYPHLQGIYEQIVESVNPEQIAKQADIAFIALPSGHAAEIVPDLLKTGIRVIDLGGDLRLPASLYETWYGKKPIDESIQKQAVYGLSEWNGSEIQAAKLIANPGCFPTATLLALLPLIKEKAIELDSIVVDAKTGVSGAGRKAIVSSLFSEVNENFKAYRVNNHQHTPEIELQLSRWAETQVVMTFTPHLVPMTRGILATCYGKVAEGWTENSLFELYQRVYEDKPFVRIRPQGSYPQTKEVSGTNLCDIALSLDKRTGRLTVISVIDNLVKGASGQAIQNMNIMMGLPDTEGLVSVPTYP